MRKVTLKSRRHWDWSGMQVNVALHLAFEKKLQGTTNNKFVFTTEYVSKVLNNIATKESTSMVMQMTCQPPSNFPAFMQPIGARML